MTSAYRTG